LVISHTVAIVAVAMVVGITVVVILLVLSPARKSNGHSSSANESRRFRRWISFRRSAGSSASQGRMPYWATETGGPSTFPLSIIYRRMGSRQKVAGLGFIIASVFFLVLSVAFGSVVLEADSVASFVVAAILFLKESRRRVPSRVLSAIVPSLSSTIAGLSSWAGSKFVYVPFDKGISDIAIVGSFDYKSDVRLGDALKIVPPGMGLAALFVREADGASITMESLRYLLPSLINENFGLAEGVEVFSSDGKIEVVLHKPAVFCSCQRDESRSTGVVGCTVSSFLAVLYSYGSQGPLSLDRCTTDSESGTWRVSMTLQPKGA